MIVTERIRSSIAPALTFERVLVVQRKSEILARACAAMAEPVCEAVCVCVCVGVDSKPPKLNPLHKELCFKVLFLSLYLACQCPKPSCSPYINEVKEIQRHIERTVNATETLIGRA